MFMHSKVTVTGSLCLFLAFISTVVADDKVKFCYRYRECSDNLKNITDQYTVIECYGAKSCENSSLKSSEIWCNGDSSCKSVNTNSSVNSYIQCGAFDSCSKTILKAGLACDALGTNAITQSIVSFESSASQFNSYALQSFTNNIFQSKTSTLAIETQGGYNISLNQRRIYIYGYGSFDMYNSTIISNGNDVYIYMYGYYSGYGLTVNCTNSIDNCIIHCFGTGCINSNLDCVDSNNNCFKQYVNQENEMSCQYSLNNDSSSSNQ